MNVKRTAAVLILAGLAATGQAAESRNGSASATLSVSATVVARVIVTTAFQASSVTITRADIARGYVDAPAATRLQVRTNSAGGYLLAFESTQPFFTEVRVAGAGDPVAIASGNGWIFQPFTATTVAMDLSYRFALAPNAEPGEYPWPLVISARTL